MAHSFEDVLVATLRLRFGSTLLEAQIYWPSNSVAVAHAPLALLLANGLTPRSSHSADLLGRGLAARANVVVLRVPDRAQCLAALTWAADHADELGSQADRLMVAGGGHSGTSAARLAIIARDEGWPVLQRQVLVHPRFTVGCQFPARVAGVAAATIVSGTDPHDHARRYAARLKRAGVEVGELRQPYLWRRDVDDEMRMMAELVRALQTGIADHTKG
jgi:hypothetical protein